MISTSLQEKVEQLLRGDWHGEKRIHGLRGGASAYLLSLLGARTKRPILVIAPTTLEADTLFQDLAFFLGEEQRSAPLEKRLHLFPSWEVLPFENLSPHPEHVAARLEGLYQLMEGQAPILVSTPAAMLQRVIPKEALRQSYLYLVVGQELAREPLLEHLVGWGFQSVPLVEERGDFSIRGGILDIFLPAYSQPVRLELCDDRLESIREFDPSTQRSRTVLQEILLLPMKEFSLQPNRISEVLRDLERRAGELDLKRKEKNPVLDSLRDGIPFPGMEFLVPYFYPMLFPLFSFFPSDTLLWLDQPARVEEEVERYDKLVWERAAKSKEEGRLTPPAERLYLSEREWRDGLAPFSQIHSEPLDILPPRGKPSDSVLTVKSYLNTDLHQELSSHQGKDPSLAPLVNRLKKWEGERIFIVAPTDGEATRIKGLLAHYEVDLTLVDSPLPLSLSSKGPFQALIVGGLTQGVRLPEDQLILVTMDEILGTKRRAHGIKKKIHPSHFITSLSELKQDDYVVHLDNGVGIYRGLKFLKVAGAEGEFLHLEYQGGDRLYLPVDRINLIQKFIGGDEAKPALDRLGGSAWEKVKAKTRKSVLAMAKDLLAVYAAREVHHGHVFPPPDQLYQEFEASFEFEETPDQERAIHETLRDMQQGKPMDRLICGDVGYGKTEVALRAAFLAVMEGKQVAVLAPTTILAQQHFENFRQRFSSYPVRVEILSRFLNTGDSHRVLKDLAKGMIDIIIGTHRLLQKNVQFKDLALIVIDEEHRFGVAHKENLKKMRQLVDVISLTATPIPRTLHMSLIGIRDLSIIETPPQGRLAIRTYITRYDEGIIRDAVLREINRGGQVFFLHNRVETISRMAEKLMDLVPEAKIGIAHGQMAPRELKKAMFDFMEHRTQLLVCSAIIESGLDFPNANTMIINRADRFGLAQLYQLRGRVGRSTRRAYAYLLIPGERIVTRDAEKRLRALQELDELGGGFRLALHDLEIRGAGNLLGKQQSGHIAAVGLELYTQMMEEAVLELKGEEVAPKLEPEIRLGIPAYFPDDYIPNTNQRLLFYKRLAGLSSTQELGEIQEEIRDRYGAFPPAVEHLFKVMDLRRSLRECLVEQINFHDGTLSLLFHAQSPIKVDRLLDLITKDGSRYKLSPDRHLSFAPNSKEWGEIIQEVTELLHVLHQVC
jgi:transcription-repair coupling factor (superfamily II helicase)